MSEPKWHTTQTVEETEALAGRLAGTLRAGQCVAIYGEIGAGKTQFVRGLVAGLGGSGADVSSPTYVLMNMYPSGRLKVFHLDAYRVVGASDFESIGFAELLTESGVVVVEWPERIEELLPADVIRVWIEPVSERVRRVRIEPEFLS